MIFIIIDSSSAMEHSSEFECVSNQIVVIFSRMVQRQPINQIMKPLWNQTMTPMACEHLVAD